MLQKQRCLSETGSAYILRCKFVAAPVGRDRYKEKFSVLIRRTIITRSPVSKTEEIKWNRKQECGWGGGVVWPPRAAVSRKLEYLIEKISVFCAKINLNHWATKKFKQCVLLKFVISVMSDQFVYSPTAPNKTLPLRCIDIHTPWSQGRIKLFGAPRQWKHFRPLLQAVFLSGGVLPLQTESKTTLPSPKTEITNILFYILNFASIIKFKM